jgi:hypothetical protein
VDEQESRKTPVADAGYLAGGGALFASAFLYWVARGPGSGLRGHALVDAVVALGRDVPALSTGRLTILWYLVPGLGAASWIACGFAGARSRAARIIAGVALAVTVVVGIAFARLVGVARLGWGPKLAVAGAVALCLAAWWPVRVNDGLGTGPSP